MFATILPCTKNDTQCPIQILPLPLKQTHESSWHWGSQSYNHQGPWWRQACKHKRSVVTCLRTMSQCLEQQRHKFCIPRAILWEPKSLPFHLAIVRLLSKGDAQPVRKKWWYAAAAKLTHPWCHTQPKESHTLSERRGICQAILLL
jgi:hypothetical protein